MVPSREQFCPPNDIWQGLETSLRVRTGEMLLASSGKRPEMRLNILLPSRQPCPEQRIIWSKCQWCRDGETLLSSHAWGGLVWLLNGSSYVCQATRAGMLWICGGWLDNCGFVGYKEAEWLPTTRPQDRTPDPFGLPYRIHGDGIILLMSRCHLSSPKAWLGYGSWWSLTLLIWAQREHVVLWFSLADSSGCVPHILIRSIFIQFHVT